MNFKPHAHRLFVATLAVFATAAASSSAHGDEKKYLRFVDNGANHQLQTSVVHFQNADGVKVDLIGAVHIADGSYYDELNTRFKSYDALLYEMVKPKGMVGIGQSTTQPAEVGAAKHSASWISMFQRFMKDQLDLDFQLDKINYDATNFVHADLDAETFIARQEARGESMMSLMLNQMLHELNKPDGANGDTGTGMGLMDLVQALQSPDRARELKLVLGREFENMDDALDSMGGPDGSVILTERNAHAMQVLKDQVAAGKKKIAVFYGAAHLRGMEAIMIRDQGFKQVGDPEWLVAWDLAERSARPAPKAIEPATTQPTTATSDARWSRDGQ